jgi:hypothetical protein
MSSMKIEHDDDPFAIIDKLVQALEEEGILVSITPQEMEADGYVIFDVNLRDDDDLEILEE